VLDKSLRFDLNDLTMIRDTSQPDLPVALKMNKAKEELLVEGATFNETKTSPQPQTPKPVLQTAKANGITDSRVNSDSLNEVAPIETIPIDLDEPNNPEPERPIQPVPIPVITPEIIPELAPPSDKKTTSEPTEPTVTDSILDLSNIIRQDAGLPALASSDMMNQIALQRASELVVCTSHLRPDGRAFYTILTDYGVTANVCAENFACATDGAFSPNVIVQSWMRSDSHKANILSTTFSQIGIGLIVHECNAYFVQFFIG
jgi:uncharacterized protein YkwD